MLDIGLKMSSRHYFYISFYLGPKKEDLSKGYFDVGDHMKFTFPMAYSITIICWGLLQ